VPRSNASGLEAAHHLVQSYRASRPGSKHLPKELWGRILPLLESHSQEEVASRLGIGLANLARRARQAKRSTPPKRASFVEIPLASAPNYVWELELPGGIKLRGLIG